jgi:hypothetical protein
MFPTDYVILLAALVQRNLNKTPTAKTAGPGPRKGKYICYKYTFWAETIICKALARHILDDGSSSDHNSEGQSDGNNSPAHSSQDDGEVMDLDEDNDLHGQDSRHLVNVFQAKVCLEFQLVRH